MFGRNVVMNFFISSTFKDFRIEREKLRNELLPKFRDNAFSYGDSVSITDLQWGLDNFGLGESESAKLVLSACLDAVDSCRPCFVALIGQRYGYECKDATWLPEKFVDALPDPLKSITELEITYALREECDAVICIRTIADLPDDQRKNYIIDNPALDNLKAWLRQNHKDKILEYCASWQDDKLGNFRTLDGRDFFGVLLERLEALCRPRREAMTNMPWQERENQFTWQFVEERATAFFGRTDLLTEVARRLTKTKYLHLIGEGGTGKTSLLCKLAADLRAQGNFVICLFGDSRYNSARAWLEQMIFALEKHLNKLHETANVNGLEVFDFGKYKYRFEKLCAQTNEKIFFILDGCDRLDDDAYRNKLAFLPRTTKNVHCLLSYTDDFKPQKHIGDGVQILPLLSTKNIVAVLKKILQSRYKRSLFSETAQAILKKSAARNFLFLHMAAQLTDMISSRELIAAEKNPYDIVTTTVSLVDAMPDSPKDAAWHILRIAAAKICRDSQAALDAVRLIGLSRSGLRFSDLETIFGSEIAFDYVRLRRYLSDFFMRRSNDVDDFSHRIIKQSVIEQIAEPARLEAQLANHLETLPEKDPLRKSDGFYYAQRLSKVGFASKLLEEATEDFFTLQEIRRVMLSDGGNFGCTVLKGWRGNVIKLFQNLLMIMTESIEDRDVFVKLLDAAQSNQKNEINLHALKILIALAEVNFEQSQSKVENLKNALDEAEVSAERIDDPDKDFCRLMYLTCDIVGTLNVVFLSRKAFEAGLRNVEPTLVQNMCEYSRKAFLWLSRTGDTDKQDIANFFKEISPDGSWEISKNTPASVKSANAFIREQYKKDPVAWLPFITITKQLEQLVAYYSDDHTRAVAFGAEAMDHAKMISSVYPSHIEYLKVNGITELAFAQCEYEKIAVNFQKREFDDLPALIQSVRRHAKAGLQLLNNYCKRNPNAEGKTLLDKNFEDVIEREKVFQAIIQSLRSR